LHTWNIAGTWSLSDLLAIPASLCVAPNGDDTWRLSIAILGTRSDGGAFEFRRDNLVVSDDSKCITWTLAPHPLGVVYPQPDPTGLPLNPPWRGFSGPAPYFNADNACAFHRNPLDDCDNPGDCVNDWGRCTVQTPTYDRSWHCSWHVNWFPVTFTGT